MVKVKRKKRGAEERQGKSAEAAMCGAQPALKRRKVTDATPCTATTTSMGGSRVFVDNLDASDFARENIVSVDEPWARLLDHLEKNRIALVRAPPRSGKTMLGKLASLGRVAVVVERCFEVRYCSFVSDYDTFLGQQGFRNVVEMARDSGASARSSSRKTIVYFFDEVGEIPEDIYKYFIKEPNGYAVFVSTSRPVIPSDYVTPAELLHNSFFYRAPASRDKIFDWLAMRVAALFGKPDTHKEVLMATTLLLGVSVAHIGIIQYIGSRLEEAGCRNIEDARAFILAALSTNPRIFYSARCFGLSNGLPTVEQSLLVSMLRCSGQAAFVNAHGVLKQAWKRENREHRLGLAKGLYAPTVKVLEPLVPQKIEEDDLKITFTHMLQPDLYHTKFQVDDSWMELCHENRWVVNFSRSDVEEPAKLPTHVVDLVLSWLSNIDTVDLVNAQNRVDPKEDIFQGSLGNFCKVLGIRGRREVPVSTGNVRGSLDLLVNDTMGIELLIRASGDNRYSARRLLQQGSPTLRSLLEHVSRAHGKYASAAGSCTNGYVTVLPATLTGTTVEHEWENFKAFIDKLREDSGTARALAHHIMVAVTMPGWDEFTVFLHDPDREPVKCCIPRQRLLFKMVDGQPRPARQFYPTPDDVWVQRLRVKRGGLQVTQSAVKVSPAEDSVAGLTCVLGLKLGLTLPSNLKIYKLNHTQEWWELVEEDHILYANTKNKPYGFIVLE